MNKYTKSSILLIAFFFCLYPLWGQSTNITLNQSISGNQLYEATQSIKLNPGFIYSNTNGAKFTARIVLPDGQSYQFNEATESTTLPVNTAYPVGTIPGNWSVSSSGAATYTIPIKIAPGIRDIVPNLFISYNHQASEGLLGLGWNLGGLSSITRVATNLYHETYIDGVDFDISDKFALDGNRLIVSNGGTYGANNTEYRSEIESFVKVTSYGISGNGPSWFKVETKDGKILEYGNTADSRIEAQGRSDVLVWNLNKVSDKNGTYMTITYTENNSTGEYYPSQIKYSGHGTMAPFNTIDFEYQNRNVPFITYVNGSQVKLNSVLSNIYIKNEGTTVGRYQFVYNTISRLTEIVYYGKNNSRLNSTYVNWGTANTGIQQSTAFTDSQLSGRYQGDYNGDGKTDLVIIKSSTWYLYLANSIGDFSLQSSGSMPANFNTSDPHNRAYLGDYNGDGKMDLLVFRLISNTYYLSFLLSTGTGFSTTNYSTPFSSPSSTYYTGDFNGDGLDDLMIKNTGTYNCLIYSFNVSQSTFSLIGQSTLSWGNQGYSIIKEVPLDINGNGKNDLMVLDASGCRFYELTDGSTTMGLLFSSSYPTINNVNLFGDFNGDGKTDIFSFNTANEWKTCISKDNGLEITAHTNFSGFNPYIQYNNYYARDINGDGKSDLIVVGYGTGSTVNVYVAYSNGQNFSTQVYAPSSTLGVNPDFNNFGDYNGDGTIDFYFNNGSIGRMYTIYRGKNQEFVSQIKNGFGVKTQFVYKSLTDNTIYTKGTSSSYPVMDFQGPLYVTSSVIYDNISWEQNTTDYTYSSACIHRKGKGFLGFNTFTSLNTIQNLKIVDTYEYNGTFFNVSLKQRSIKTSTDVPVALATMTNSVIDYGSKRILPYVSQTIENSYLNNVTKTTSVSMDTNGNPGTVTETFDDGSYNSTTYSNYTSEGSWLPAKPQTVTVTKKHYQDSQSFSLTTNYTYYPTIGLLETVTTSPATTTATYGYIAGNLTDLTITDGNSTRYTQFFHDNMLRFVTKIINPLTHTVERTFDGATGNMLSEKTPNGKITTYTYDDFGQLTGVLYPTSHTASVSYQWATGTRPQNALFFKLATSPGLPTGKEYYDAFGRVIKTETTGFDGVNICTNTTYNHKGQIEETSLPYKSGSQAYKSDITYDAFGRLATQSSATGIVTFTSNGKTFQTATGTGQTSSKVMDSQGHVLSVTDEGGTITNVYKSIGSPYQINTHGTTWTISYDALGRQISLSDPDAGTTQYRYNKYNELTSQTNARGFKDSLTYDVLGRVTSRIGGDGTTTYVYDPANNPGLLNNIAYPGGNETYTYDTYGRLTNVQQTVNDGSASTYSTGYGYDNQNRITTVTYPSSFAVTNVFNTNGYLSEVKRSDNNATIWKANQMNSFGIYSQYQFGNNLTTYKTYSPLGVLQSIQTGTVQSLTYSFDPGTMNMTGRNDILRGLSEAFSYDNLNRLTSITGPSAQSSTFDDKGNITWKTDVGNYSYATLPHAVSGVQNASGLIPSTTQKISYTCFNKVDTILEGVYRLKVFYGSTRQRNSAKLYQNGTLQKTIHYVGNYEKEVGGGNTRQLHYITGGDGLAAIYEINNGTGNMYYLHSDHLGSYDVITNSGGTVAQYYSFDAWGRRRNPSNWSYAGISSSFLFNRGYTGHEHLDAFGLINMNGRMYDPLISRMLSPDNFVQSSNYTQGFNRFVYGNNSPLMYTDPNGELAWFVPIIIGAVIGAYTGASVQSGTAAFWDWDQDAWKGAIVGAFIGAAVGAGVSAAIGPSGGIVGMTTTTGEITQAWGVTTSAINGANINMAFSAMGGGDLDNIWKAGVVGAASSMFTATGGFGLAKHGFWGKLGTQMIGTSGTSIGNNWAAGADPFSRVTLGVGPVNLTLGKGQKLFQWQNNLGNIITNGIGLTNLAFGGKMSFNKDNLAFVYTGGFMENYGGAWGPYAIQGPDKFTNQVLPHELHHIVQSRVLGDTYLLHYGLQGLLSWAINGFHLYSRQNPLYPSFIYPGTNYFETVPEYYPWW
ncbi:MAG: hypothetical protein HC905_00205 [Bacteroidales bacterium]|nr:hypothetical protein [Bacteroidales bacterium]